MYTYSPKQWIAFFIVYCFIGWAGESLYVSWEYRKWTNRGFLNGPFLPIYGFGAIVMLFCTLPVRRNVFLTFLFGMIGATLLEYLTGYFMEKLFHVRYWDYSYEFVNLNGYICLACSVVWGLASVFLIKVLHKPVEKLVVKLNDPLLMLIDIVFIVYFVWDIIISAREAFDLRKFIDEQILQNEKVQRMQKRLDVVIAVAEDDKERMREKIKDNRERINVEMAQAKAEFEERMAAHRARAMRILKRNPGTISRKHKLDREAIKSLFK